MKFIVQKLDNGYTLSIYDDRPVDPQQPQGETREVRIARRIVEDKDRLFQQLEELV